MKKTDIQPTSKEREFKIDELFFSTTDKRGVITAGNEVFARIAGYSMNEMLGEPHNIIRHPHMPRAVFKLLWDYLLGGKSIAAYVKNMSITGDYYWVVALVIPVEDGFLSVRFKPSSNFFPIVQNLYGELLKTEQHCINIGGDWRDGMAEAYSAVGPALEKLGFRDYDAFMSEMLRSELQSREEVLRSYSETSAHTAIVSDASGSNSKELLASILKRCIQIRSFLEGLFSRVDSFVSLNEKLQSKSEFILNLAKAMRLHALNANTEATRLGDLGRTLAVISNRMGESSELIAATVRGMRGRIQELSEHSRKIVFGLSGARLQIEMVTYFIEESLRSLTTSGETVKMVELLIRTCSKEFVQVLQVYASLTTELAALTVQAEELDKVVRTLHFIRINGKVETARSAKETNFLSILDMVSEQIDSARSEFQDLEEAIHLIRARVKDFPDVERSVQTQMSAIMDQLANLDLQRVDVPANTSLPAELPGNFSGEVIH